MHDFGSGDSVSRKHYGERLASYFAPSQQFASYLYRWAGVQAGKVLAELSQKELYTQYRLTREELETEFKSIFGKSVSKYFGLNKAGANKTMQAASAFRGGSPFMALVQDPETNSGEIVSYNLMALLRRAALQALPVDELLKQARQRGQNTKSLQDNQALAAYRLLGWNDDYRQISIRIDRDFLEGWDTQVCELNRFMIECAGIPELKALNDDLYQRLLVAFLIKDKDPYTVKRALRLGVEIELFVFTANNGVTGTITFGRDALLVDSVYSRRKSSTEDPVIW
jgi:hypothetical protein